MVMRVKAFVVLLIIIATIPLYSISAENVSIGDTPAEVERKLGTPNIDSVANDGIRVFMYDHGSIYFRKGKAYKISFLTPEQIENRKKNEEKRAAQIRSLEIEQQVADQREAERQAAALLRKRQEAYAMAVRRQVDSLVTQRQAVQEKIATTRNKLKIYKTGASLMKPSVALKFMLNTLNDDMNVLQEELVNIDTQLQNLQRHEDQRAIINELQKINQDIHSLHRAP